MSPMKRYVVDTNMLGSPELAAYLQASKHHFGIVTEATMIELHKTHAADVVRDVLRLPCRFPRQIILLRDEVELVGMDGATPRLVRRLVDEVQTSDFPEYCATIVTPPIDKMIRDHFSKMESQSDAYMKDFTGRAGKIFNLFRAAEARFDENDVVHLRKRQSYPIELQKKLIAMAFAVRQLLIRNDADAREFPTETQLAINTYLFRYCFFVALYFARWIKSNRTDLKNEQKIANQLMDMKIGAVASFFDGLLTNDAVLSETYEEAVFVSGSMGGYVRCGKGLDGL